MTDFAAVYRRDLFDSVLPFWMNHSIDRTHGGFFTCLDRDGSLFDSRKYIWLNGRQVWMLSKLYNECEPRPEWLEAAKAGAGFLRRHAFDEQGRCYFSLTPAGRPVAYQRKPYGAVFVALGWLEYAKASNETWALQAAIALFDKIRSWIADPALMGRPALAGAPAVSQLADIMVVTSLALELARATGDPRYDAILEDSLRSALAHRDPSTGVLLENISVSESNEDLRSLPEGRLVSPGHSLEVSWFLLDVLERRPDPAAQQHVLAILEASLEFGWDRQYGGLLYFMDVEGKPALQLEAPMKLWWPHTEAIYALVRAWALTGSAQWLGWLERVHEYTYHTFPDPAHGEWYGYCDRAGKPSTSLKGNNYKGCFHVPRSLWLSIQALERSARRNPHTDLK
ncbi:MAG: AGE family epimerase/isomerase [Bryobacteraceae bacterium]